VEVANDKIMDVSTSLAEIDDLSQYYQMSRVEQEYQLHERFNAESYRMIKRVYVYDDGSYSGRPFLCAELNTQTFGARNTYLAGVDESEIGYSDRVNGCLVHEEDTVDDSL
jgi:hypothetical protein